MMVELNEKNGEFINGQDHYYLTKAECKLMSVFMERPDKVISWDEIISETSLSKEVIRGLVSRLRKKIGKEMIVTHNDYGYRLNTKVDSDFCYK